MVGRYGAGSCMKDYGDGVHLASVAPGRRPCGSTTPQPRVQRSERKEAAKVGRN